MRKPKLPRIPKVLLVVVIAQVLFVGCVATIYLGQRDSSPAPSAQGTSASAPPSGQVKTSPSRPAKDSDGDGVADPDDDCAARLGTVSEIECAPEFATQLLDDAAPSGAGQRAEFCRLVGKYNFVDSRVQCTAAKKKGFGQPRMSGVIDWGLAFGRTWVDVDGDHRADFCRRVGNENNVDSRVQCTLSSSVGFDATHTSDILDWGQDAGRSWVDVSGDGRADFCRIVGNENHVDSRVQCTLVDDTGFGPTRTSSVLDWGLDLGRAWADVNGDDRADFCRRVGRTNKVDARVVCTLSTATGWGRSWTSSVIDWGHDAGRAWVDANADGRADLCRVVGTKDLTDSRVACTLSDTRGFGASTLSEVLDWGPGLDRAWVDVNRDGRADFCRREGERSTIDSRVQCTVATDGGFGATLTSPVLNWGHQVGRSWVDVDGDDRADFCRVVGRVKFQTSRVSCVLATPTGFAGSWSSDVLDWGYTDGRGWASS